MHWVSAIRSCILNHSNELNMSGTAVCWPLVNDLVKTLMRGDKHLDVNIPNAGRTESYPLFLGKNLMYIIQCIKTLFLHSDNFIFYQH